MHSREIISEIDPLVILAHEYRASVLTDSDLPDQNVDKDRMKCLST